MGGAETGIYQALIQAGSLGMLILYLVMERKNDKDKASQIEEKRLAQERELAEKRLAEDAVRREADGRRTAADLEMARGMTALAMKITDGKINVSP